MYALGDRWLDCRKKGFSFRHYVKSGPGSHPLSSSVGTNGTFPAAGKWSWLITIRYKGLEYLEFYSIPLKCLHGVMPRNGNNFTVTFLTLFVKNGTTKLHCRNHIYPRISTYAASEFRIWKFGTRWISMMVIVDRASLNGSYCICSNVTSNHRFWWSSQSLLIRSTFGLLGCWLKVSCRTGVTSDRHQSNINHVCIIKAWILLRPLT